VLLAYLPHAENESVAVELQDALNRVVYDEKGLADQVVVKALGDKHPLRRAAAVVALGQGDVSQRRDQLGKLLLDPVPFVRFRAALTLAQANDSQAVSALIGLLGELPDRESCEAIEDFLAELAGEFGPEVQSREDAAARRKARDAWAKWWRNTEGAGLLDELKKRTTRDTDRDWIRSLIRKLGDDRFTVREKAQADLIRLGETALSLLKQALRDSDQEVRRRSDQCIASIRVVEIEFRSRLPVLARLIALRKPSGAAEAVLAFLPSLDDDGLVEELQNALNAVAFSGGKPQPAILKGLGDRSGVRRAAAARALCSLPRPGHLEQVRKLLQDPKPVVRLKVALALACAGDHAAVHHLVSFVAELPAEQSLKAEDYLSQLAGGAGPMDLPEGEENRKKRSMAWSAWLKANEDKIALVDPFGRVKGERFAPSGETHLRGYLLLVQSQANAVTELGRDGKPRWTLTGLAQPCDAQVLRGGRRVLVAEQNRVTERDLRGKVLWQKAVPQPLGVQRLRNGHTFIVCNDQLLEVNQASKEVLKIAVPRVVAARKLPNGQIVALSGGLKIHFDRTGHELKSIRVDSGGGCNEVLDNGHVLAAWPGAGELREYDNDGNVVNQLALPGAQNGFRLANGHTLIFLEGSNKVVEFDKKWKPVKETTLHAPAYRVKRR
jgi:HEAT repeat protein